MKIITPRQADTMFRLLKNVLAVMDMTDPDHEDYADSAADTVQALLGEEAAIREIVNKIEKA